MKNIKNYKKFNESKNKFDLVCIGYKIAFTGDKMWYYKLVLDNNEYVIIHDEGLPIRMDSIWTDQNEFEDSEISDELYEEIESQMMTTPKVNNRLADEDGEKSFFTKHEIKEAKPIEPRKGNIYKYHEVNRILSILQSNDFMYNEDEFKTITQDICDDDIDLMRNLVGYKFKYEKDGTHKNDGQMVEYTFTFVSPTGKVTEFDTEMCLMVGWNYHESLQIN